MTPPTLLLAACFMTIEEVTRQEQGWEAHATASLGNSMTGVSSEKKADLGWDLDEVEWDCGRKDDRVDSP